MKNTLVIGDSESGKTTYLQDKLKDVDGVFWVYLGTPKPAEVNGCSIWNFKEWQGIKKQAGISDAKVVVLEGLSHLQGLLLAGLTGGKNPEQRDYGAAAYQLYAGLLEIGSLGVPVHATVLTRVADEKVGTKEIFLTPMASGFTLPFFPAAVYTTVKIVQQVPTFLVQENSLLAKQLIAAKGQK